MQATMAVDRQHSVARVRLLAGVALGLAAAAALSFALGHVTTTPASQAQHTVVKYVPVYSQEPGKARTLVGGPLLRRSGHNAGPPIHSRGIILGRMLAAVKLSPRQAEVAQLIAAGLSNREVAKRLGVGERAIEWHVEQIFNKLRFHSRTQIAAWIEEQRASWPSIGGPRARTNLPIKLTSFVGREADLTALHEMLARSRLVTLTGPGGVGKTRLALQFAWSSFRCCFDSSSARWSPRIQLTTICLAIAYSRL